eukprot:CAMPEP_0115151280 /NCGR_PEP_ID=MMETSP0227-20121206/65507_1 /TAXON_ID=89957 /ORGANISM="Polarella glacialis, Strain CCMP 1383" /LENGTH=85 /DNA_ID=CAMNT_0002561739 /DNA_START=129 /DNA_END=386 /DNA_ORIENTATION=+
MAGTLASAGLGELAQRRQAPLQTNATEKPGQRAFRRGNSPSSRGGKANRGKDVVEVLGPANLDHSAIRPVEVLSRARLPVVVEAH